MTLAKRLLFATDFSDQTLRAEDWACALAASWQAPLTIITVLEFPRGMAPSFAVNEIYLTDRLREATELLTDLKRRATQRDIDVSSRIATGIPSEEVIAAALAENSDLVIVGMRGKSGLAHALLGSTAERVIRTAPCPVLAVHMPKDPGQLRHEDISLNRILVPVDFSDCSLDALEYAAMVAGQTKASLEVLHVLEPVYYGLDFTFERTEQRDQRRDNLTKRLDELAASLTKASIKVSTRLRGGVPADMIIGEATGSSSDLVVMGTHGRRGLSHLMGGSVAEAVLRRGNHPILTVRNLKTCPGHRRIIPNQIS
ncbi:putative Universal stress protein [Nitrospira sp. KM1]|uniref:universal stress protein n=1 Tax=Nitrospira sp. KM1 TaxID=1936990 RepID=UPI0013A79D75|nr:universal stress protein [Nitrospira sp. KM1]BCA54926.1 putative Universal stress protein [Nitrospira sp. KM1]